MSLEHESLQSVMDAFGAQPRPAAFVRELIAQHRLKGPWLAGLRKAVMLSNRPDLAPLLWLVFSPTLLSIELTQGRCNLACRMCGGARSELKFLTPENLRTMLEHIPTAELITFMAGDSEPLLHPQLPEIFALVNAYGVAANVVTNGHLLNDALIDRLIARDSRTDLNISLDAATAGTYRAIRGAALEHVTGNLRHLRDRKRMAHSLYPRVALLMVGMRDNIAELPAFVELAAELGAFRVMLSHMKGEYEPGDFVRHPDWPAIIRAAAQKAAETGVALQLPADISAGREPSAAPAPPTCGVQNQPPQFCHCSWIDSVQIGLAGAMAPCCHIVERNLGNILERDISQQLLYLRYRMGNLKGAVEPGCLSARNCAYVDEQRARNLTPPLMDL